MGGEEREREREVRCGEGERWRIRSLRAWRVWGAEEVEEGWRVMRRRERRRTRAGRLPSERPGREGHWFEEEVWGRRSLDGSTDGVVDAACWIFAGSRTDAREHPSGAPDMYTSLNARLYSRNFHSPRKPRVPMLNARMGGTRFEVEKRDAACRIVPSPPKVAVRSTFCGRREGSMGDAGGGA